MLAVPCWFIAGVTVSVLLVNGPPKVRFAGLLGTNVVLSEVAATVRFEFAVSTSLMRNGRGPVLVLAGMPVATSPEIEGGPPMV